jgi:hypothetical protein
VFITSPIAIAGTGRGFIWLWAVLAISFIDKKTDAEYIDGG